MTPFAWYAQESKASGDVVIANTSRPAPSGTGASPSSIYDYDARVPRLSRPSVDRKPMLPPSAAHERRHDSRRRRNIVAANEWPIYFAR